MRTKSAPPPADLRERVLAASVALIEAEGLQALSLREVARRAGVSHQAPYHHFSDREAILAAVVEEGFGKLGAALRAALDPSTPLRARTVAVGLAYVDFALAHPGHFKVMFRPELVPLHKHDSAREAGDDAFGVLQQLVALHAPGRKGAAAEVASSLHWAVVHGLAVLLVDGPLGAGLPGPARHQHARAVLEAFVDGLALPREPAPRQARRTTVKG